MKNAGTLSWSEVDSREAALIRRCTAGDQTACAELVAEHQRMVFTLALNLLRDRDEALDLSQEVFLRVFRPCRASGSVRPPHLDLSHRINQARNRQRRRRHRSSQVSLDDHLQQCGELESSGTVLPDRALASKETAEKIWRTRPFAVRSADRLVLREIDGLRYEEIAFSLGVAVGTVKSRLTRARQSLREELLGLRT